MRPPATQIVAATLADLWQHPWSHLRASAPLAVLSMVMMVAITGLAGPLESLWIELVFGLEDEVVGTLLYLLIGLGIVPMVFSSLPYLPMHVGLLHTQWAWIEDGEIPSLGGVFRRVGVRLPMAAVILIPMWSAQGWLIWAGFLPAVVVEAIGSFVLVGVVVEGRPLSEALTRSIRDFAREPLWRLWISFLGLVGITVSMVLVVPLLLYPALYTNALLRAYRAAMADPRGPEDRSPTGRVPP